MGRIARLCHIDQDFSNTTVVILVAEGGQAINPISIFLFGFSSLIFKVV